jgi:CDP-diacylglycerol--glycerol-3-phosphate 3-phosphatidyltransferase
VKSSQIKPWGALSWPNRISILRLLLVGPFVVLLLNQRQWGHVARYTGLGIFLVMAFSDFLDGVLARRLDSKTRLGSILDPLADKTLIIFSVLLLARQESAVPGAKLPNWVVVAVVAKDLWVIVGFVVVYLVTDRFRVRPTLAGKASTAGQLVMVICVLLAPELDRLGCGSLRAGRALLWVTSCGVVGLSVLAIMAYTRLGLGFIVEGQKPLDGNSRTDGERNESD